jgi:hypothetical protein
MSMVEALRHKGNPVGYFLSSGEQHGFRKAGNIQRCLDAELAFYAIDRGYLEGARAEKTLGVKDAERCHFDGSRPIPVTRLADWPLPACPARSRCRN